MTDHEQIRALIDEAAHWRREAEQFRSLFESKQLELAGAQRALEVERIQWREALREEKEHAQRWRRKYEAKEWK